jgi:hypothetical protein
MGESYPLATVSPMASQGRQPTREEEGRLSLRTLAIASAASAAAAIVVSQFWIAGTPIAAALTPVIVTLVSEMLSRPTEAVARRLTTERTALMPEAMGAGPPEEEPVEPPPTVARDFEAEGGPVRVYRPQRRRRIHPKVIAVTAALAFAIAAAIITVPELIAGGSIGKRDGRTTLFGGSRGDRDRSEDEPADQPAPSEAEPEDDQPEEAPASPPEEAAPPAETVPQETVPTTPTPTVPEAPLQP